MPSLTTASNITRIADWAQALIDNPQLESGDPVDALVLDHDAEIRVCIPHHKVQAAARYQDKLGDRFPGLAKRAEQMPDFSHFGLKITFPRPVELTLWDGAFVLDDAWRRLLDLHGALFFSNALISQAPNDVPRKNVFANLMFHLDRGPAQPNQISIFSRDPRDPRQIRRRQTSTLFVTRKTAYLQSMLEKRQIMDFAKTSNLDIFGGENIEELSGRIILEQKWNAPDGTGEIGIINNRTLLHASYYQAKQDYPIGTRHSD